MKDFSGLLHAMRFLTVIPIPFAKETDERIFTSSMMFFPLVGFFIGVVCAFLSYLLSLFFSPFMTSALVVALWVVLTGALHLDGFADTVDGIGGGRDREERLAIMKDSRIGTFGAVSLFLVLILKVAFLSELTESYPIFSVILAAATGRWVISGAIMYFPSARPDGMGALFKKNCGKREFIVSSSIMGAVSLFCLAVGGPVVVLLTAAAAYGAAAFLSKRLGGLTGDSYGALCEFSEAVALFLCVIVYNIRLSL